MASKRRGVPGSGGPSSGPPGLTVGANDSGLEGAWALIQAEQAFSRKVCVWQKMPQGARLTSLRLSHPTVNFPESKGVSESFVLPEKKAAAFTVLAPPVFMAMVLLSFTAVPKLSDCTEMGTTCTQWMCLWNVPSVFCRVWFLVLRTACTKQLQYKCF